MSTFLNNLRDKLTATEQQIENLPGELDSIVARLDRGNLRSLFLSLNQDFNRLLDKLSDAQRSMALVVPVIMMPSYPFFREITNEDLAKWREAYKSDIRVVVGKGKIEVMAACRLVAQQQGYIVLSWDQYQKLLDEIGNLIGRDEERGRITGPTGTIMGVPLPAMNSPQEVKVLPKSPPFDL